MKTAVKKFEAAAVKGNRTEAEGAYKVAVQAVDRAAALVPGGAYLRHQHTFLCGLNIRQTKHLAGEVLGKEPRSPAKGGASWCVLCVF